MIKRPVGKEISKVIKLYLPAQNPTANTMLNPTLGQAGINSFEFTKKFNDLSKQYKLNVVLRVHVFLYIDKTFDVVVGLPPLSYLLNEEMLKYNGIKSLSEDNIFFGSKISLKNIYKISFILKKLGFPGSLKAITRSLLGTLKSMHCVVINDIN